jgi:hypothetical protein
MSDVTEIRNVLDPQKLDKRVLALIQLKDRLSIPPDVIYQVVLDPLRFSPSRTYLHFDRKNQIYSDVHGWFPVEAIEVLEVLCECDEKGVAVGQDTIYAEPLQKAA